MLILASRQFSDNFPTIWNMRTAAPIITRHLDLVRLSCDMIFVCFQVEISIWWCNRRCDGAGRYCRTSNSRHVCWNFGGAELLSCSRWRSTSTGTQLAIVDRAQSDSENCFTDSRDVHGIFVSCNVRSVSFAPKSGVLSDWRSYAPYVVECEFEFGGVCDSLGTVLRYVLAS